MSVIPPAFVKARARRFALSGLSFGAGWACLWLLVLHRCSTFFQFMLILGVWTIGGWIAADILSILEARGQRRLKAKATEMGNALCCQCGYSLRGLVEQRQCPECGWEYDRLEAVQAAWRDWEPKRAPWWFRAVTALIRRLRRRT